MRCKNNQDDKPWIECSCLKWQILEQLLDSTETICGGTGFNGIYHMSVEIENFLFDLQKEEEKCKDCS